MLLLSGLFNGKYFQSLAKSRKNFGTFSIIPYELFFFFFPVLNRYLPLMLLLFPTKLLTDGTTVIGRLFVRILSVEQGRLNLSCV